MLHALAPAFSNNEKISLYFGCCFKRTFEKSFGNIPTFFPAFAWYMSRISVRASKVSTPKPSSSSSAYALLVSVCQSGITMTPWGVAISFLVGAIWSPIPVTTAISKSEHKNGTSAPTFAATFSAPINIKIAAAFPEPAPSPDPGGTILWIMTLR